MVEPGELVTPSNHPSHPLVTRSSGSVVGLGGGYSASQQRQPVFSLATPWAWIISANQWKEFLGVRFNVS